MSTTCILACWFSILAIGNTVPNEVCFEPFNWQDCGQRPRHVLYYYQPGSRCEVAIWRGCPTRNMFKDEYECISTCIYSERAQPEGYHLKNVNEIDLESDIETNDSDEGSEDDLNNTKTETNDYQTPKEYEVDQPEANKDVTPEENKDVIPEENKDVTPEENLETTVAPNEMELNTTTTEVPNTTKTEVSTNTATEVPTNTATEVPTTTTTEVPTTAATEEETLEA